MILRPWKVTLTALCGLAAASSVLALGFGRIPDSTVFGRTLDLSVPLLLEPGEALPAACLGAEVSVGEQRLSAASLQLTLERFAGGSLLRVRSPVVVLEPVVSVSVSVGCQGPVSRQFVVFADPPATGGAGAVPALATDVALASAATAPAASSALSAPPVGAARAAATAASSQAASKTPRGARKSTSASRSKRAAPPSGQAAQTSVAKSKVRTARLVASPAPQLKLDEPETLLQAARLAVATQDAALARAEQAAGAAQAAASAAEGRLLAMENELSGLRTDAAAHRATVEQMRSRLAQAEDRGRITWLLSGLLVLLAAVVLWLGVRLRALQRERQSQWWQAVQAPVAEPDAVAVAESPPASPGPVGAAAMPLVAAADPDNPLGDGWSEAAPVRPLSVDELIDVEQQADFFVVLGEDESAVDLLMTHLRGSGGVSPLPYLKLLEIYRRSDNREAYERTRKRFNQRFNAVAPHWDEDLQRGRSLIDHPGVLATLQAAWPQPLDAMAELENLLFRKQGGELFDLPAYRDVLSLYAVARDLHRRVDDDLVDVDVLLPLGPGHEADATARLSIFDRLDSVPPAVSTEDLPTSPIDLDLSAPEVSTAGRMAVQEPVRSSARTPSRPS